MLWLKLHTVREMKRIQKTFSKIFTTLQVKTLEKYDHCFLLKKKTFTLHVKYTMVYVIVAKMLVKLKKILKQDGQNITQSTIQNQPGIL